MFIYMLFVISKTIQKAILSMGENKIPVKMFKHVALLKSEVLKTKLVT